MKIKENLKKFYLNNKERIEFLKNFILLTVSYGLVINFMLWSIFNLKFNYVSFIGYGVLFYLIKYEFVDIFNRLFPKFVR